MKKQSRTIGRVTGRARWALMIIAIAISTLALCTSPAYGSNVISFPDANLEAAVAAKLGKQAGTITDADMAGIVTFSANSKGIQNLTGLEYAHNMTYLALQGNQISDLTPLAGSTSLSILNLANNAVSDVAPLAGVTSLTRVNLENNSVSDLTPLSGLASLVELGLQNDAVVDLSPLAGLQNLSRLVLTGNAGLAELSPLADLVSLTELYVGHTQVSDSQLVHLSGLTSLTRLDLEANGLSDLASLAPLTGLQLLILNGNEITDLGPLAGLTSLQSLHLRGNEIADISPLVTNSGLSYGDTIYLDSNHLDTTPGSPDMVDVGTLQGRGVTVSYSYQIAPGDGTPPMTYVSGADSVWHNNPVALTFSAQDNPGGSDVAYTEYSVDGGATWTRGTSLTVASEGSTTVSYRSVDSVGNVETAHSVDVKVDTTAPTITLTAPADGAVFVIGQAVTAAWSASDGLSGIATTQPTGTSTSLDTATLGQKTFVISATDRAGNTASQTLSYAVAYATDGLTQPVNGDGSSIFKAGSNVPLRFDLIGETGLPVTGLQPRLYVSLVSDDVEGTEVEAVSSCQADAGNIFRETSPGEYQFNLSTKGMATGFWRVRIDIGNGAQIAGYFSLR